MKLLILRELPLLILDDSLDYGEYRQLNQEEFQKLKELMTQ